MDEKISQLTGYNTPQATDVLPIVNVGTSTTQKIAMQDMDTFFAATTKTLTNKTLTAPVIATIVNTGTLTLPTSTDTLIGRATTDVLMNKTFDTAGTGNIFKINGTGISAISGTGAVVLVTSPTLITPILGVAAATTINKVTITAPATGSTLTIADGKTLTANNTIILAGTDSTTMTFPSTSQTIVGLTATQTLTNKTITTPIISSISNTGTVTLPTATDTLVARATTDTLSNKRITARVVSTTQSATPTINTDNTDVATITALAQAITSFTTNLSGTPVAGDALIIYITDNGTARGITWGSSFEASTVALPTTTVISTLLIVGFFWNAVTSKWRCVAVA